MGRRTRIAATLVIALTPIAAARAQRAAPARPATAPTAAPGAAAAPAELTTTALPGPQSWISDRRDFRVGDIVTILVDEYTLTSLDKQVDAQDDRSRQLGFGINTPTGNKGYGLSSNNGNNSTTHGLDARTNRLTTEMSARVVAVAPNGIMQLKGAKRVSVEDTKVVLTLTGWVRTQDVSPDNLVQSFRMADAQLDYKADGPLGTPKSGILGRIIGALWP